MPFEGFKRNLEASKGELETKGLRRNLKKTQAMISEKFEEVVYKRRKFPDAVCRKRVSNNPIFCQFCNC